MIQPTFTQDLRAGQQLGEIPGLHWLGRRYQFREATPEEQVRGIDLVGPLTVEWKVQLRPGARFFVETHAPGLAAPGWALGSEADVFALSDAVARFVVLVRAERLRARLEHWLECYGQSPGAAPTKGRARTRGIWVPWFSLEAAGGLFWLDAPPPDLAEVP